MFSSFCARSNILLDGLASYALLKKDGLPSEAQAGCGAERNFDIFCPSALCGMNLELRRASYALLKKDGLPSEAQAGCGAERRMAERAGFEPAVPFWGTYDFQSYTFGHSVTSP